MALDPDSLKNKIVTELQAKGFVTEGKFAKSGDLAEAIANAVVAEITANAEVIIATGNSAGTYDVT